MSASTDDQYKTSTTESISTYVFGNKAIDCKQQAQQMLETEQPQKIVIKIPDDKNNSNVNNGNDPPQITKQTLLSIIIVMLSVFLDFMGASIVEPILPFYAKMFDATSTELGALFSSYSAMSLLASFGMGKFSDNLGRKPMILFSLFGTCVGFLATGLAQNYEQLLAFRFLAGFFGATAPVAMAVVTDAVPEISRAKYIAATGAMIPLAFIAGPGLGSGLAEFGIRVPFFVSSGLGAFGFVFAFIFLKETNPTVLRKRFSDFPQQLHDEIDKELHKPSKNHDNDVDVNDIDDGNHGDSIDTTKNSKVVTESTGDITDNKRNEEINSKISMKVWVLCTVQILTVIGCTVLFSSMFVLYMIELYDVNTLDVAYILLSIASFMIFGNILFVKCSKYIGMYKTTIIGSIVFGISLLIVPYIDNMWTVIIVMVFGIGIGYGVMGPAMAAIAASFTNIKNRGTIMGLMNVSNDIAMIIGPMLHGILYSFDKSYPFWAGSATVMMAGFILICMMCKWPEV